MFNAFVDTVSHSEIISNKDNIFAQKPLPPDDNYRYLGILIYHKIIDSQIKEKKY